MESLNLFAFSDYRSFIRAWIDQRDSSWGVMTQMAKAAQCQRPYLSRVLKGEAQLTPAQAYGLAKFWGLGAPETEYFLGLLEQERAGSSEYREYVGRKAKSLKTAHEELSSRVKRVPIASSSDELNYFSAWYWSAIHMLVSIPEFQTVQAIARRLAMPPEQVEAILHALQASGHVAHVSNKWKFVAKDRHVPKNSPLVAFHHANWRHRALLDAQLPKDESVHFTVVQSVSKADYERIKWALIEFIELSARIAGPSQEEEMYCLSCDFFKP